jgi:nucleoside 2-deoxyribosyltransferase
MRRLICFIACAFKKTNVDRILNHSIIPVLKKNNIIPKIVNRVEHNENIDQKINKLIEGCDFAIADLTYARPSVYYEAGYAGRIVPVIYTVRSDHFRQRDNDPEGTRCVHFDLQMKNIVGWKYGYEKAFEKKLLKRVKYVVKPLVSKLKQVEHNFKKADRFNRLSLKDKITGTGKILLSTFRHHGYKEVRRDDFDDLNITHPSQLILYQSLSFIKKVKGVLFFVNVRTLSSATKVYYDRMHGNLSTQLFSLPRSKDIYKDIQNRILRKDIKQIINIWIICSLNKVKPAFIRSALSDFTIGSEERHLFQLSKYNKVKLQSHVYTVDGQSQENAFKQKVICFIKTLE